MNGLPSENVDDLDKRLKHIEYVCDRMRSELNKLFAETRDLLKAADLGKKKPDPKNRGIRSGK